MNDLTDAEREAVVDALQFHMDRVLAILLKGEVTDPLVRFEAQDRLLLLKSAVSKMT